MGNSASTTTQHASGHGSGQDEQEISACPVQHGKSTNTVATQKMEEPKSETTGCPVNHGSSTNTSTKYKHPHAYNVYGQKIDPTNQMPANPNQDPAPDQKVPLSKERLQSTIRKGGTESTWLYPSEQMFYNALKRKNKGQGVTEYDMQMVIAIHNGTNERAWKKVLEWEKTLHCNECDDPTLLRFMGKPNDLSPMARIKTWFGKEMPFDRHDWIVDRCGKEVRYVLDFYYKDDEASKLEKNKDGFYVPKNVEIEVRPALDSVESFVDRFKMVFQNNKQQDI